MLQSCSNSGSASVGRSWFSCEAPTENSELTARRSRKTSLRQVWHQNNQLSNCFSIKADPVFGSVIPAGVEWRSATLRVSCYFITGERWMENLDQYFSFFPLYMGCLHAECRIPCWLLSHPTVAFCGGNLYHQSDSGILRICNGHVVKPHQIPSVGFSLWLSKAVWDSVGCDLKLYKKKLIDWLIDWNPTVLHVVCYVLFSSVVSNWKCCVQTGFELQVRRLTSDKDVNLDAGGADDDVLDILVVAAVVSRVPGLSPQQGKPLAVRPAGLPGTLADHCNPQVRAAGGR